MSDVKIKDGLRVATSLIVGDNSITPSEKFEVIGTENDYLTPKIIQTTNNQVWLEIESSDNKWLRIGQSDFDQNFTFFNTDKDLYVFYVQNTPILEIYNTGQIRFNQYTSDSAFSGTEVGLLGFDNSGNIVTVSTTSGGGTIDGSGTANYIARWDDSDTLTDSLILENATTKVVTVESNLVIETPDSGAGSVNPSVIIYNDDEAKLIISQTDSAGFKTASIHLKHDYTDGDQLSFAEGYTLESRTSSIFPNPADFRIDYTGGNTYFQIFSDGQIKFNEYIGSTFDASPEKVLGLDASGNIITFDQQVGGGGGSASPQYLRVSLPDAYLTGGATPMDFDIMNVQDLTPPTQDEIQGTAISYSGGTFTVNADGLYTINVNAEFQSLVTQRPMPTVFFRVNGTDVAGKGMCYVRQIANADEGTVNFSRTIPLFSGDQVTVHVYNEGATSPTEVCTSNEFMIEMFSSIATTDSTPTLDEVLDAGSVVVGSATIVATGLLSLSSSSAITMSGTSANLTANTGNAAISAPSGDVSFNAGTDKRVRINSVFRLDSQTADPTSPTPQAGDMYFNTSTSKFRGYNGTSWVDLG